MHSINRLVNLVYLRDAQVHVRALFFGRAFFEVVPALQGAARGKKPLEMPIGAASAEEAGDRLLVGREMVVDKGECIRIVYTPRTTQCSSPWRF
jgi:hypothetical protein